MATSRAFVLKKLFQGFPTDSDFKIVEEKLSALKDGEFLAEALYLTVDPYMRGFLSHSDVGKVFGGEQVAVVKETKNKKYPVGKHVVGYFGWRTHTTASENPGKFGFPPPRVIPDIGGLSPSLALGVLGMPGHTAYFGFLELCKPKEGDTVVISGAGGAVGSHVGQLAKIKGCRAVGIAGTDEKGKWLVDELGFDAFINYKDPDFAKRLEEATPKGIDSYFDNVGGEISSTILYKMNKFGRVVICGSISSYNDDPKNPTKATEVQTPIKINHLHVEGMNVFSYVDRWNEAFNQNLQWIKEGKLKYRETISEGFENTPLAFIGLFHGNNIGKAIVKVK